MFKIIALMVFAGWIEDVQPAAIDAARLDVSVAVKTRYLTIANIPIKDRADMRAAISFWANSLSRESRLATTRIVTDTLLALNIDDYQWKAATFDKLADEDPFFHVRLEAVHGNHYKFWHAAGVANGKPYQAGYYEAPAAGSGVFTSLAPWLDTHSAASLVASTQSPCPILRADWFLSRIAIQADRKVGYYDFLGVKDRKEFQAIGGLDQKLSEKLQKETAAVVRRSGVGNFPRQIFRLQGVTGAYWFTKDVLDNNRDERNALRQTFERYQHQAEEIYIALPNGLFGYFAGDDKGVRQDSAPDKIGSDKTAPGNDARIHNAVSCVRCHVEGLRPINDFSRAVYGPKTPFVSPDEELTRRFQRVYLDELAEYLADDSAKFARSLKRCNGLTPAENAKVIGQVWKNYVERDYTPADAAGELGLAESVYLDRLRNHFAAKPPADPVLLSHIAEPPIPIRSDDWEQLIPLVIPIVRPLP